MGMADRGPTHVYNDFSFWLGLLYSTITPSYTVFFTLTLYAQKKICE